MLLLKDDQVSGLFCSEEPGESPRKVMSAPGGQT